MIHQCPLCNKELISDRDKNNASFVCQQKVNVWQDSPITHYRIYSEELDVLAISEIIFIIPYRLTLVGNRYCLSKQCTYTDSYCTWDIVASFPKFDIKSEDYLRNKIKTLIVFS